MEKAPLLTDIADAPEGGSAWWLTAADGVRLRLGVWQKGDKGTVLLLPGRTEYIEKYGRTAGDLAKRGYAMASIDWRGQGLADRLLEDPAPGHVAQFMDYQIDLAAMLTALDEFDLPKPYYLIGHSMGGCIGLRALQGGLGVNAAAFTGPMWGIKMAGTVRPAAWGLSWLSRYARFGHKIAPGTGLESYVTATDFDDNMLTTDRETYALMNRQLAEHPELALAGPSLNWLYTAMAECRALQQMPAPDVPVLTFLGTRERIVDADNVRDMMANWPNGTLRMVDGAEHEVLMEKPQTRQRVFDEIDAFFGEHR